MLLRKANMYQWDKLDLINLINKPHQQSLFKGEQLTQSSKIILSNKHRIMFYNEEQLDFYNLRLGTHLKCHLIFIFV